ncbi:MAG: ATP-binding protein [Sulfuricurvum sp.]|uniref:ATP-binding protein n=1 Tax=Sulfuricurvum sp. TaxID=2025608 RepID=UPI00260F5F28|nr:ATP-binding protein [Sulfuricurvum sp.]MDD2829688.1 ATP-binding protein [Sulfuricurvum sp.]MDD4950130.1 ATP-binding protein [Sulfuricurvum sp.]
MRYKIGTFKNSIATLELKERTLYHNTLILGETGSGKTHLANKIRHFVMACGIPTLYLDFSDPSIDKIEEKFKDSDTFFYLRFEESEAFEEALNQAIAERRNIYMAVNPSYFASKRSIKSQLSKTIQKQELLDNYYYFFQEIESLNGFYTKFEDFIYYVFDLVNLKKFGFTFLTQPNEIFENPRIKLLFTFLYLGRCSNAHYYNTSVLRSLKTNTFYYQYRMDNRSLLFNQIKSDIAIIDD